MFATRSRMLGLPMAAALALTMVGATGPVTAADSPEAAVNELLDDRSRAANSRTSMRSSVPRTRGPCETRSTSRPGWGSTSGDPLMDAVSIDIGERAVTLLSEDGDTATLAVTATMSMSIADDQIEDLVRAVLEAEQGPDDPPPSDEDVEMMMGFMGGAFDQTQELDEEITVVREDGEWVVCGGLFDESEGPTDAGIEPTVSTDGICGITSPAELSSLSALAYDSSGGFAEFCSFYPSDFEAYHTTTVSLELDDDVEQLASLYGADQETEVAGARALATGPDAFAPQLFTQVGPDVLLVSVTIDYDAGVEPLDQAALVTELLMPRVPEFRETLAGSELGPEFEPVPEASLCDALSLAEMNELTGLGLDETSGGPGYCAYTSSDGEPGYHNVSITTSPISLSEYGLFMMEPEELTVAGQPALADELQLVVELPGGDATLITAAFLDSADESTTMTAREVAQLVAERALPVVPMPEPLYGFDGDLDFETDPGDVDLEAILDELDSVLDGSDLTGSGFGSLPQPMCEYFDLEAINALGVLEFDEVSAFSDEMCAISQLDFASYSSVLVFVDPFTLDEQRTYYPGGTDLVVGGLPAYASGSDLWIETEYGSLTFSVTLPDDSLEPLDVTVPLADLVLAAIGDASE